MFAEQELPIDLQTMLFSLELIMAKGTQISVGKTGWVKKENYAQSEMIN